MLVGVIKISLFIPDSLSLKMKRGTIKSIKQKLRNKFNISVSEVDHLDKWQRACIGVSIITNETKLIEQTSNEIMKFILSDGRVEILEHSTEIL